MKQRASRKDLYLILFIIIVATFLRFYRLNELMMFIGDFGWFYVSARDMLLSHSIPLVGITASHTWLHQGPFWTYVLAVTLGISHFNPLSGGYLAAGIGVVTVVLLYYVGLHMFSRNVAFSASVLFATSPLVIIHSRMPYHTSPIPFFSLLLMYCVWKWVVKEKVMYFSFTLSTLAILYNFELATQVLWIPVIIFLLYGFVQKKAYGKGLINKKMVTYSLLALLLPMIPILIYDSTHKFPQTVQYGVWIVYHIATVFGYPSVHVSQSASVTDISEYLFTFIHRLLFLPSGRIAVLLFVSSVLSLFYFVIKEKKLQEIVLGLFIVSCLIGIIISKSTSEAYLPMSFPFIILMICVVIQKCFTSKNKSGIAGVLLLLLSMGNIYSLLSQNYLMGANKPYGLSFTTRKEAAYSILTLSQGKKYTMEGRGEGSQFVSYTKNYEYLTWVMGNGPSHVKQKTIITVNETPGGVNISVIKNYK